MIKRIGAWLTGHRQKAVDVLSEPTSAIDSTTAQQLDDGMALLQRTTADIAQAATAAAAALKDQLHWSTIRFYSTIDAIDVLVLVKDAQDRWITLNKAGQRIFGWMHNEYYLKTNQELIELYPQFSACLEHWNITDEIAWATQRSYKSEEHVPYGAGDTYLELIKSPVFSSTGARKELVVVGRDISREYDLNMRMKACFTAMNDASDLIVILDEQARVFFCNDRFAQRFHVGHYSSLVGKQFCDVVRLNYSSDEMWLTVRANKSWAGSIEDYGVTINPVMNGKPVPIYYVCIFQPQRRSCDPINMPTGD